MPKTPERNLDRETISMMVVREPFEDEIEVVIEIEDYIPAQQGGTWDEKLADHVVLGDSFDMKGKHFELTELEQERAQELALEDIRRQIKQAEDERAIMEHDSFDY